MQRRWCGAGRVGGVHVISGVRDPAVSFPLAAAVDDRDERHQANRAVAVSATGLAVSGLVELVIALVSGSAALLGDALHNLSDVSTSLLVFVGFRASRRAATPRYPYGFERAEDLAGIGVAAVMWASAAVAGAESVAKLVHHGTTQHLGWGIAAAAAEILGNQLVARYKLAVGRRIQSATMIADAKHSWLDALSSAGAMLGLVGVALGWSWADAVAPAFSSHRSTRNRRSPTSASRSSHWSVATLDTGRRPCGHRGDAKFRDQHRQNLPTLTSKFAIS